MDLLIETKWRYRMKNLKQIVMFKGVSVSVAEWKHYRRQFCTRRASFCRRCIGLDIEQSGVRKITDCCSFNRPLHNAPLPAVSSAPLASDPKKWLLGAAVTDRGENERRADVPASSQVLLKTINCSSKLIIHQDNRPLHNAPLPAVSSAPLASDPKRWLHAAESRSTLDLLPEDLSLLCLVKARLF